ncbi:MAG: hypothetical protein M1833_003966 [Piccolia ochrophora]|nr:MAG: hypothetical protein M1833_003966 [Piccolia ochrophora]
MYSHVYTLFLPIFLLLATLSYVPQQTSALGQLTRTPEPAAATSFCKCSCAGEYEIIPLDDSPSSKAPHHSKPDDSSSEESKDDKKKPTPGARNCNDCNRQFCLDYNLPKCKEVKEKEVVAICFQRDSAKDQAVVLIFIFATVGLLVWAAVRGLVGKWLQGARQDTAYVPVADHADG